MTNPASPARSRQDANPTNGVMVRTNHGRIIVVRDESGASVPHTDTERTAGIQPLLLLLAIAAVLTAVSVAGAMGWV